jgi:hypothetical protein
MRVMEATVSSVSPYSQSRFIAEKRGEKELADDFERRIWRERCHTMPDGSLFIPPMQFKNCLANGAAFIGEQIPGRGKERWTKHFLSGVLVTDPLVLPVKKDDVPGEWFNMNAQGKKGPGPRVLRCYPMVAQWTGTVTFYVLDEMITQEVFEHHLKQSGQFIGIGRFRPQNGGFYGRFKVEKLEMIEV